MIKANNERRYIFCKGQLVSSPSNVYCCHPFLLHTKISVRLNPNYYKKIGVLFYDIIPRQYIFWRQPHFLWQYYCCRIQSTRILLSLLSFVEKQQKCLKKWAQDELFPQDFCLMATILEYGSVYFSWMTKLLLLLPSCKENFNRMLSYE